MAEDQDVPIVAGRSCAGCTMCCKLLEVVALDKPARKWCPHCAVGRGCGIYETRPRECRAFYCGWMVDASIPGHWAPKQSRMVVALRVGENQVMVHVDPDRADSWRQPPYVGDLQVWARQAAERGRLLLLRAGGDTWALLPDRTKNLGRVRKDQVALRVEIKTPRGPRYDVIVAEPDDPRVAQAKANAAAAG